MTKKVFLVDYENTSMYGLRGISELKRGDKVVIFHSSESTLETLKDILKIYETHGIEIRLHALRRKGRFNALDFMICTYLGYEVAEKEGKEIYILSADRGYESAIALGAELNSNMKVGFERSIYQCVHKKEEEKVSELLSDSAKEEPVMQPESMQVKPMESEAAQEEVRQAQVIQAEEIGMEKEETEKKISVNRAEKKISVNETENRIEVKETQAKETEEAMEIEPTEVTFEDSEPFENARQFDEQDEMENDINSTEDIREDREASDEVEKDKVITLHSDHKKEYRRYNNGRYRYSKNNYHRSAYRERQSCREYMQRKMERDNIIPKQYHTQLISFMDKSMGRHEFEDKAIKSLGAKNGTLMSKAVMYYEQYQSYKERQSVYY